MGGGGFSNKLCGTLVTSWTTPWTAAHKDPLSMGFPRQEHWSGLLFPSPGNLPDPLLELVSPALQVDSLPLTYLGSPYSVTVFGDYLAQAIV